MHNVILHEFKKSKTVWYVGKRWITTHVDLTVDGIMDDYVWLCVIEAVCSGLLSRIDCTRISNFSSTRLLVHYNVSNFHITSEKWEIHLLYLCTYYHDVLLLPIISQHPASSWNYYLIWYSICLCHVKFFHLYVWYIQSDVSNCVWFSLAMNHWVHVVLTVNLFITYEF